MAKGQVQDSFRGQAAGLKAALPGLTAKQHEVMRFVAENRTSKEIAWELGISESAVNQRIEGVRGRTGSPPRAELARAYRQYLHERQTDGGAGSDAVPDEGSSLAYPELEGDEASSTTVADGLAVDGPHPAFEQVVPPALDGVHAGLNRIAAIVVIAGGMLLVAMVGLGVVHALTGLI